MLPDTPKSALPVYQPLVGVLVIASAGILADRFLAVPVWIWLLLAAVALVRWRVLYGRAADQPAAIALLVAVFCLGAAWHHRWWNLFAADDVGRFATREAQPVVVEGIAQSGVRRVPAPPHNPLSA